jgi:hypothetical protein
VYAILERCRKIVLVLSDAVLVIGTDAKNCIHELEHEHRRKGLSTSTTKDHCAEPDGDFFRPVQPLPAAV